jgi:hypothetical protein
MLRFTFRLTSALLLTITPGCGNSHPPVDSHDRPPKQSTPDTSTRTGNSQASNESDDFLTDSETSEASITDAMESDTLKQAMIDVTADLLKKQQPDTELTAVRGQVEDGIAQIREDVPYFLMVSAEAEKKLQAGTPLDGAAKRIADVEAVLNEYGIPRSGRVVSLLEQYKARNLSPVRTELLAQLIAAHKKKVEDALSN